MPEAVDWSPPEVFDEYRLVRRIGRGGMGEVFLAHDTVLDRPVAVKFIGAFEPDSDARERFLIEARAAARLQHPNVVAIYRVGELDRRPYLITEFIRGESLNDLAKPVPWKRALELGIGLARGLAAAHRQGVLHRDIKPANAVIAEHDVKLLDFGLAKLLDSSVQHVEIRADANGGSISTLVDAGSDDPVDPMGETRWMQVLRNAKQLEPPHAAGAGLSSASKRSSGGGQSDPGALTRVGSVLGTPAYLPPEIWRGESATRRSDVHALGAVLYELCTGFAPTDGVAIEDLSDFVREHDIPPLCSVAPSVDPRFGAIIDRCLLRDPTERFASGDELREALEELAQPSHRRTIPEGNPYRWLSAFEAEDRALFFGRDGEIRAILDRLRSEPCILVAGDSGAGKSSLCLAGVLPLVAEGVLGQGREWSTVSLTPGRRPLTTLAAALAHELQMTEEALALRLRSEPSALARELRKRHGDTGLVLFIDQLEDLVIHSDPAEAAVVADMLGYLTSGVVGVRLLMAVRSDFLTRVASLPGLGDQVSRALYLLRPMSPDRIREAIVGPAQVKGVTFESEALVNTLVDSTANAEGGLPLLQFALAELWEARNHAKASLTVAALDAVGGVAGALARHADQVVLGMLTAQRAAAQRILTALVTPHGTRSRRTETELVGTDPAAREALNALVRGRLLVAGEADEDTVYEIAHEALLDDWDTLRRWLDEHKGSRIVRHRLRAAVAEWERLGRTRDALWSERQLKDASILDLSDLTPREAAFIRASQRTVRRGHITRRALIVGVPLAIGLAYSAVRLEASRDLNRRVSVHVKEAEANLADAREKSAAAEDLRRRAFAQFDAADVDNAGITYDKALTLSAEADLAYGRASEALETSLMLDRDREHLQGQLADILYDRALAAERDRRTAQRDELLRRLALYDQSGERRRRWNAPAHLTIETTPPGAMVSFERFIETGQKKRQLTKIGDLGVTPVRQVQVEQGSVVLTLSAPGRAPIRYPIVLGRAEQIRLAVDLPMEIDVPEGFVYVPPGRFLFGSASDDESRRGFYNTAPLHPTETPAYLIARYETTYAEWIDYLRALPPEERTRRIPAVSGERQQGAIKLEELPNGSWQLSIRPTIQTYTAKSGDLIHYSARRRRASQNWLRFPVSGITFEDAHAYTSWLATSGRVPGARLCREHEWERAARGADDREYPHGDRLDPDDANFDETYGREPLGFGPDEVGSHPASRSPFGLDDMAGNVWSWVVSAHANDASMARGGSYYYGRKTNKVVNREVTEPTLRDATVGLRVCATPVR